ncbi:MAG: MFS transporter [bacterium]|nr:MFS transporter [bacterium]
MLRKFIKRFVPRTHYWRNVGFDELSEIYASQMLRSLALSLVSIFVPVYLYTIGYSFRQILLFFAVWFASRLVTTPFMAKIVGRIGPKHSILLSQLIQIVYLSMLMSLESMNWPIYLLATIGATALGLFWIGFHTDLSKVRHPEHAGKELSYVNNFERIGAILGPLIGGLVANFYDPRYTIFIALVVMVLSSLPLLATKEPVILKQKIRFRGFPYRENIRTSLATAAFELDTQSCQIVWPLYVAVAIFGKDIFGKLGAMAAMSVALGLLFTHAIGRLIDNKRGGELLLYSSLANSVVYLLRPFANTILLVFGINLINDPITTAMKIPFLKGYHDAADSYEGYRIVFFAVNEWITAFVRMMFWLGLFAATYFWPALTVMKWHFVLMAVLVLGILLQRFPALYRQKA